ncbi:MAG: hydroxyethylthiazole kinase [Bacillota bacterium]
METKKIPVLHHITNAVASNLQAQVTELMRLTPIMGNSSLDAHEIAHISSGLVLNLGMPNPDKLVAIKKTVPVYEKYDKPIVLDPVGISMSDTRLKIALDILENRKITVVKGNLKEMQTLIQNHPKERFSEEFNAVLVTTGKIINVKKGSREENIQMPESKIHRLPGTGCILATLIGCLILKELDPYHACVHASRMMATAAEKIRPNLPYGKIQEILLNELEVLSNENLSDYK